MDPDFSHNKGNRIPIKIHPLRHGVPFHPSVSFLFFLSAQNLTRAGIDELVPLSHKKPVACTRDKISNAPTVNTINRILRVLYYIVNFRICTYRNCETKVGIKLLSIISCQNL